MDDALYRITSQWPVEQLKIAGKREQLLILLREVGPTRFAHALQHSITEHESEFCPSIGVIRKFVSHSDSTDKRSWWRDPNCSKCHGTGWQMIPHPEADKLYKQQGHQMAKRCRQSGCLHRREAL